MRYWITPDGNYYVGDYVADGSAEVTERPSSYHEWQDGEWVLNTARHKADRITALQAAYATERNRLNDAWLSAIIADGSEETARKAAIKVQMDALDAQLESDILAILMEE